MLAILESVFITICILEMWIALISSGVCIFVAWNVYPASVPLWTPAIVALLRMCEQLLSRRVIQLVVRTHLVRLCTV